MGYLTADKATATESECKRDSEEGEVDRPSVGGRRV